MEASVPGVVQHICQHSLPRTDLHLCLANGATDRLTGLPLGLCSLALRYLLPTRELERYLYCLVSETEETMSICADLPQVRKLLTGSSSEGLSVPTFCRRAVARAGADRTICDAPLCVPSPETPPGEQPEGPNVTRADTDCMFEIQSFPVSPERGSARLYLDATGASHRGYVRVLFDPSWSPPEVDPSSLPSELLLRPLPEGEGDGSPSGTLCISSDALMQVWHEYNEFSGTVERHGPAINSIQMSNGLPVDFDSVPALPLTRAPPELLAWVERVEERQAAWPPEEVRARVSSGTGAHLVATGHASSARRDLEWRLSFSVAEKMLSRTLTIEQRKVYLLVKLVQKCFLAKPKVLVTYHLKTLMFWELETTNHCWSEEHLFDRVLGLLDRIDACLSEHRIPSYFFPENNLISDCSVDDLVAVRRVLGLVRRDPLRSLFAIDSTVRFQFSTTSPLLTFHAPFLDAIIAGASTSSAAEAASAGLVRQARDGLVQDGHTVARASELLRDALQLRQPAGADAPRPGDWLLLTAAAVCAAAHRDEDIWVRDVLRRLVTSAVGDSPPLTERHVRLWEAVCPSGVSLGHQSPFITLMLSCLDGYGDRVDRRTILELFNEFIVSGQPQLPNSATTTLMFAEEAVEAASDLAREASSSKQHEAREVSADSDISRGNLDPINSCCEDDTWSDGQLREASQELCSALQSSQMDSFELSKTSRQSIVRKLIDAGIPKSSALSLQGSFRNDLIALSLAGWDELGSEVHSDGWRSDQILHKFERINSLETARDVLFDSDALTEHVNMTNAALLDTLGYLLINGHHTLANRTSCWLRRLMARIAGHYASREDLEVTFNFSRASRFLACLPEAIRSLLLLTPCEISLPATELLIVRLVPLLETAAAAEKGTSLDGISPGQRVAELLDDWEEATWSVAPRRLSDKARLSDAVLKLCLVKLAGGDPQQCADCLTEVEERLGSEVTAPVRRALTEHVHVGLVCRTCRIL